MSVTGGGITPGGQSANTAQSKSLVFNLNAAAATYTLATAVGDVWVEVIGNQVKVAAGGLTSAQLVTDHATPKAITASTILASLTLDANIAQTTSLFLLPSGKRIQGIIVGTGNAGEWDVFIRWSPATAGASLA